MRDLLYKNLTSSEKGRKTISSSEVTDKEGIRSVVRRHFSCLVKHAQSADVSKPLPYFFLLKERDSREKREHFFCKIKGSLLAVNDGKLMLILFVHTLSVELTASPELSGQTN